LFDIIVSLTHYNIQDGNEQQDGGEELWQGGGNKQHMASTTTTMLAKQEEKKCWEIFSSTFCRLYGRGFV